MFKYNNYYSPCAFHVYTGNDVYDSEDDDNVAKLQDDVGKIASNIAEIIRNNKEIDDRIFRCSGGSGMYLV